MGATGRSGEPTVSHGGAKRNGWGDQRDDPALPSQRPDHDLILEIQKEKTNQSWKRLWETGKKEQIADPHWPVQFEALGIAPP